MDIIKSGRPWVDNMSNKEIINRTFDLAYLLQTNEHPTLKKVKDILFQDYKVIAEFKYHGFNGNWLYCNGRCLIKRPKKGADFIYSEGVKLISGEPLKHSGSNKYPTVRFKDDVCTLEFISNGLPHLRPDAGWSINVLELETI